MEVIGLPLIEEIVAPFLSFFSLFRTFAKHE
jgi:hypothetical protein